MELKRFSFSKNQLWELSSIRVKRISEDDRYELLTLGFFEGEELISYVIFSHLIANSEKNIFLEYIYVSPDYRGKGISKKLLYQAKEYIDRLGNYDILCKHYVKPEHAIEYNDYMTKRGFVPLNVTQKLLFYHLKDLERPGAIQLVQKNLKKLPKVVDIDEVGLKFAQNYLHSKGRSSISIKEIQGKYTRFYMENNVIDGAIIAAPMGDDALFISAVIMDRIARRKNIFLIFFSECLEAARKDMGDDISIIFQIDDADTYKGMLAAFNPPGVELFTMEHMLIPVASDN